MQITFILVQFKFKAKGKTTVWNRITTNQHICVLGKWIDDAIYRKRMCNIKRKNWIPERGPVDQKLQVFVFYEYNDRN
jgi:hypothetical protein